MTRIRNPSHVEDALASNFKDLQMKISPERRARVELRVQKAIKEMALDELRTAREFTQAELSQVLKVDQGSISKLERRTDMYIGTLRRYIEAMGGSLQIRAIFPDGEVQIKQFQDAP
jgi:predicted XRE-type DNA-binding protein